MTFLIFLVKLGLNAYYALMKLLFSARDQVLMLSRQSDSAPLDFVLLEEVLHDRQPDMEIIIFCKKIGPGLEGKLRYGLHLLQCTYQLARSKVVVIDGYSIPVCVLRHRKSLQVVQIWHALGAVKKFGYQSVGRKEGRSVQLAKRMNMHRNYSYILCASEATRSVYAKAFDMPKEQILMLGMPRVDYIRQDLGPVREALLKAYPRLAQGKTVVYIPTYRKSDKRGIENVVKRVGESQFNLIVRPHALSHVDIGNEYYVDARFSTYDLMKFADVIITDYSAVALEASILDKPIYFYIFDLDGYCRNRGLNIDLQKEMPCGVAFNTKTLLEKIEAGDYRMEELLAFRQRYVETYDRDNTAEIAGFLCDLLAGRRPDAQ